MDTNFILSTLCDGGSMVTSEDGSVRLYTQPCYREADDLAGGVDRDCFDRLVETGVVTQVGDSDIWLLATEERNDEALLDDLKHDSDSEFHTNARALLSSDVLKLPQFQREATRHALDAVCVLMAWAGSLDRYTDLDADALRKTAGAAARLVTRFAVSAKHLSPEKKCETPKKMDLVGKLSRTLCGLGSEEAKVGVLLDIRDLLRELGYEEKSRYWVDVAAAACLKNIIGDVIQTTDGRYMLLVPSCPLVKKDGQWRKPGAWGDQQRMALTARGGYSLLGVGFMHWYVLRPDRLRGEEHATAPTAQEGTIMVREVTEDQLDDFCIGWTLERQACERVKRLSCGKSFSARGYDRFFNMTAAAGTLGEALENLRDKNDEQIQECTR